MLASVQDYIFKGPLLWAVCDLVLSVATVTGLAKDCACDDGGVEMGCRDVSVFVLSIVLI